MLYEIFDIKKELDGENFFRDLAGSNVNVIHNLNPNFKLRDYQLEALGRLAFYCESYPKRKMPIHLLFNMATGSGKTNVMGGAVLYFYNLGYRNFIFFTRLGQVVAKTKMNFLDSESSKYVFAESISVGNGQVRINIVDSFSDTNSEDINIIFSTTSGIHSQLTQPKENGLSLEDIGRHKVVLLADEAHNLSGDTKGMTAADRDIQFSWESIVQKLLLSNPHNENVLLEFTATARLESGIKEILTKYADKALYKYSLKEFRNDGFSKEVNTLQVEASLFDRVLVALVISQYRLKVAEKYGIPLKPIILFKANRVRTKKGEVSDFVKEDVIFSNEFKSLFHDFIENLNVSNFEDIQDVDNKTLRRAFVFFETNFIDFDQLILELKSDFSRPKCLSVDDERDAAEKQSQLNDLERLTNPIRAVFATDSLNEGWDVLNLFDIVRLYNSRDAKNSKAGRSTIQEAQLIGRGARYYPFETAENNDKYRRKFDLEPNADLRVLEELDYHSRTNSRYIGELKNVLIQEGLISDRSVIRSIEVKDSFKTTDFWKTGFIYVNSREKYLGEEIFSLRDAHVSFLDTLDANIFNIPSHYASEASLFEEVLVNSVSPSLDTNTVEMASLEKSLIRTGLWRSKYGKYSKLKEVFPQLDSIEEFISSREYLGGVKVKVRGRSDQISTMDTKVQLDLACFVIDKIMSEAIVEKHDFIGSKVFKPSSVSSIFAKNKELRLDETNPRARSIQERYPGMNLSHVDWFAQNEIWGTDQEEQFLGFLNGVMHELNVRYSEIFLFRNEQHFAVYSFESGAPFYPDFILILKPKSDLATYYQVFIEPKGEYLYKDDSWKEDFLLDIDQGSRTSLSIGNYKLVGLPFFNAGEQNVDLLKRFEQAFRSTLLSD